MNKIFKYTGSIFGIIAVFAIGNYICYQSAMKHFENMQNETASKISEQMQGYVSEKINDSYSRFEKENNSVSTGANTGDVIDLQTIYQIENYDIVKKTTAIDYKTVPEELLGMNRKQVDEYCKNCIKNMTKDEYLKGLQSMGVTSFSSDKLIVKKIYDSSKIKYKYYLIAVDGEVVVYYGDQKTVYEYTGIQTSKLGKKERSKLKNGIEVKDEDELFGILENYSS